ncbi:carboxymuconolactone decarboxylase family protein [Pseudomonas taeanensis]|uniref:carboxymuconolactone decarboxylase family protein n=1 Tax=Pseudomonas taeanensis TaxID=574962 RepID=UPI0004685B39|nr:carboxymuconolactone decarboxylase family protein [Pseudomonas taeanensis]
MPPTPPLLTDAQLDAAGESLAQLAREVRARRGGPLLNLDRMLMRSVPFAQGWGALLGKVRNELALSASLRELVICKVAVLTGTHYEYAAHSKVFLNLGGSEAQLAALTNPASETTAELFSSLEHQALTIATQMTHQLQVDHDLLTELRGRLGDTQLVELVGVIAAYNMVARVLIALDIPLEPQP